MWCEEQGACELSELVENAEDLAKTPGAVETPCSGGVDPASPCEPRGARYGGRSPKPREPPLLDLNL